MRHFIALAGVAAASLAVPSAAQASCAMPSPREDRIAAADAAVAGVVVRQESSVYTLRIERVVKGSITGEELRVRDEAHMSSAGLSLKQGERVGLLLRNDTSDADDGGAAFVANGCTTIGPDDLIAAAAAAPCKAGARPAARYRKRRYAFRPRVLGCGRTPAGIPFQIVGHRLAGSERPCLDLVRLPSGRAAGCGDGRVRGNRGVDVDGRAGSLISGTADAAAGGVAVRYRVSTGQEVVRQAALVVVDGPRTLKALKLRRPFASWVADFPAKSAATGLEFHGPFGGVAGPFPLG